MAKDGAAGKQRLGDLLISEGIITDEQLKRAVEDHEALGGHLGERLVAMGAVTQAQLSAALAGQLGLSFMPHAQSHRGARSSSKPAVVLRKLASLLAALWVRLCAITLINPPSDRLKGTFFQFRVTIYILVVVLIGGSVGYHQLEGWSLLDSVYMTVISLTTVGYGETRPLTANGRVFTMFVVIFGAGAGLWALSTLISLLVSRELDALLREGHMTREIARLKDHHVICGYGRLGRHVAADMRRCGARYVVIDSNPDTVARAHADGHLAIVGDAANGEALRAVGIERAKGLVAATTGDAENTFITLTARKLNPQTHVVAAAGDEDAEDKMRTAGADQVVTAFLMGGRMLASALLSPGIERLIEAIVTTSAGQAVEVFPVEPGSRATQEALTLGAARAHSQALIVGIEAADGDLTVNVPDDAALEAGDAVVALGTIEQLSLLRSVLQAP